MTVAGGSYTTEQLKNAYKEAMGKKMPSVPDVMARLALKMSSGVQLV